MSAGLRIIVSEFLLRDFQKFDFRTSGSSQLKSKGGRLNRLPPYFRWKTSTLENFLMFPKEISRSFLWKHGDGVADGVTIRYPISGKIFGQTSNLLNNRRFWRVFVLQKGVNTADSLPLDQTRSSFLRLPEVRFSNFWKSPLKTRKEWTLKHTLGFGEN